MMAQDNGSDLARLERMERRLQALEDAEAIRNLKARYAALCDDQYDADGIAALFTEDALWESPALGRFEGREAIRGFFRGASGIFGGAYGRNDRYRRRSGGGSSQSHGSHEKTSVGGNRGLGGRRSSRGNCYRLSVA